MLPTLNERLSQALSEKWSYTHFLDILLTDEAEQRDFKQLGRLFMDVVRMLAYRAETRMLAPVLAAQGKNRMRAGCCTRS